MPHQLARRAFAQSPTTTFVLPSASASGGSRALSLLPALPSTGAELGLIERGEATVVQDEADAADQRKGGCASMSLLCATDEQGALHLLLEGSMHLGSVDLLSTIDGGRSDDSAEIPDVLGASLSPDLSAAYLTLSTQSALCLQPLSLPLRALSPPIHSPDASSSISVRNPLLHLARSATYLRVFLGHALDAAALAARSWTSDARDGAAKEWEKLCVDLERRNAGESRCSSPRPRPRSRKLI